MLPENLGLLDLGHNLIKQFQSLSPLIQTHKLKLINLQGNPVILTNDFSRHLKDLLPQLEVVNPRDIKSLSKFHANDKSKEIDTSQPIISDENRRCIRSLIPAKSLPLLLKK